MGTDRGERRHRKARVQAKRAGYWGGHASSSPRMLGKVATTPHPSSCYACGNPRTHFNLPTVQESRTRALGKGSWYR